MPFNMKKENSNMKVKRLMKWFVVCAVLLFALNWTTMALASKDNKEEESVDEQYGLPVVVYGAALTPDQKEEVRKLLGVTDPSKVREITVTGEDLVLYIKGDRHSNMYSSAKITRNKSGKGLIINKVTPNNITEVTDEMYANALLTAGVKDAIVDVASPIKVSGHSALVGIYKAYDEGDGTSLNKEHTEVANEELNLATDLAKKAGLDKDMVSKLLTEIKKEIAERKPSTKEEIQQIIDEQLNALNINISPEDRQLLIDLFEKMRSLNINFDNVTSQLKDLSDTLQKRIGEAVGDKGFIQAISDFFQKIIDTLRSIFS